MNEYWDGDYSHFHFYEKAHEIRMERENYLSWLQGAYVYDAIGCLVPVLRPFSKSTRATPYLKKPYEKDVPPEESGENPHLKKFLAMAERVNRSMIRKGKV